MHTAVEIITPARARTLLAYTPHARPLNHNHISTMASDMLAGRWKLTGEPIRIDPEGVLLNGHHRLHAVVRSNSEIQTLVVYGVDPSTNIFSDAGMSKRRSDWSDRRNARRGFSILQGMCRVFGNAAMKPSTPFLSALWDAFGDDAMQAGAQLGKASIGLGVALVARQDADRAQIMAARLEQLVTVPAGSPEQAWSRFSGSSVFKRYRSTEQATLGVRVALGVVRNENLQVLRPVLPASAARELGIVDLVSMIEAEKRGRS